MEEPETTLMEKIPATRKNECRIQTSGKSEVKCSVCGYETYPQGACRICYNCGTSTGCS